MSEDVPEMIRIMKSWEHHNGPAESVTVERDGVRRSVPALGFTHPGTHAGCQRCIPRTTGRSLPTSTFYSRRMTDRG